MRPPTSRTGERRIAATPSTCSRAFPIPASTSFSPALHSRSSARRNTATKRRRSMWRGSPNSPGSCTVSSRRTAASCSTSAGLTNQVRPREASTTSASRFISATNSASTLPKISTGITRRSCLAPSSAAGGTVTASVAFSYSADTRPNFVAPIYLAYNWTIKAGGVPADAPPMFILAATDDPLGLAPQSVALYQDWIAAKKSAELHLYQKGGHGFGMRKQNLPTDHWIERFADWLEVQGLLKK